MSRIWVLISSIRALLRSSVKLARTITDQRDGILAAIRHSRSAALVTITVTVPSIILVVIFQKRIVAGLTAGAVKG